MTTRFVERFRGAVTDAVAVVELELELELPGDGAVGAAPGAWGEHVKVFFGSETPRDAGQKTIWWRNASLRGRE
ncbi:hypothetical protein [Nocardia abscessus]|uniref:hypothetical protein n=1 Tax=Nocardia abscessus TaxID=120957 RepID=UPI0024581F9F|nr:hypothetical protein [Nocardia abscessus]